MTKSQRFTLMIDTKRSVSLWTLACQAQGWNKNDRDFRLQMISRAVGRPISSTSELNNTDDVTAVFTFLKAKANNLDAAVAMEKQGYERRPQLLYKIKETEAELAGFPFDDPMGPDRVRLLVQKLCADIGNKGKSRRVEITDVEDLSAEPIQFTRAGKERKIPSQLDQLLITLTRMLSKYKKEAREWDQQEMHDQNEPDAPELEEERQISGEVLEVFDPENSPF